MTAAAQTLDINEVEEDIDGNAQVKLIKTLEVSKTRNMWLLFVQATFLFLSIIKIKIFVGQWNHSRRH